MENTEKVEIKEPHTLVVQLQNWFTANKGSRKEWGTVTMENTAHEIGVSFPTLYLWFKAANNEEGGKLPKGLSLGAIRSFLSENI